MKQNHTTLYPYCLKCGAKLPADRKKIIERLKKSSARIEARGYCNLCWDKAFPEAAEARKKRRQKVDRKEHERKLRRLFKIRWYEKYATFIGRHQKENDTNTAPAKVGCVGSGERREGYADGHE